MTTKTIEVNIKVFVDKNNTSGESLDIMREEIEKDFANYFRGMPLNNKIILGSIIETMVK